MSNVNIIEFFEFVKRKEFLYSKKKLFALNLYIYRIIYFALLFYIQEGRQVDTLRHIFITKNNALCVTFIYINYCIVYYIFEL